MKTYANSSKNISLIQSYYNLKKNGQLTPKIAPKIVTS